jgi:hypothetical protein
MIIDLTKGKWNDCIAYLLQLYSDANMKHISLMTLGFICEDLDV